MLCIYTFPLDFPLVMMQMKKQVLCSIMNMVSYVPILVIFLSNTEILRDLHYF